MLPQSHTKRRTRLMRPQNSPKDKSINHRMQNECNQIHLSTLSLYDLLPRVIVQLHNQSPLVHVPSIHPVKFSMNTNEHRVSRSILLCSVYYPPMTDLQKQRNKDEEMKNQIPTTEVRGSSQILSSPYLSLYELLWPLKSLVHQPILETLLLDCLATILFPAPSYSVRN